MIEIKKKDLIETIGKDRIFNGYLWPFFTSGAWYADFMFKSKSGWECMIIDSNHRFNVNGYAFAVTSGVGSFGKTIPQKALEIYKQAYEVYQKSGRIGPEFRDNVRKRIIQEIQKSIEEELTK